MSLRKTIGLLSFLGCLTIGANASYAQNEAPDSQSAATGTQATPQDPANQASGAHKEMTDTLGLVPMMFRLLPDEAVAGAWLDFKSLQMNPKTALSGKDKELIGSAVAAQIPCHYCSYFHRKASIELNKANDREVREAIAVAALARKFGTFVSGTGQDLPSFQRDVDRMFRSTANRAPAAASGTSTSGATSTGAMSQARLAKNPDQVFQEAQRRWGFVPNFVRQYPREALVGAWNEFAGVQMNPNTSISPKSKALISLAVSSQIPCPHCVIFDKRTAKAAGATDKEVNEAIAMASMTRHWSTILNGNLVDEAAFRKETDQIIQNLKNKQPADVRAPASVPSEEGTESAE